MKTLSYTQRHAIHLHLLSEAKAEQRHKTQRHSQSSTMVSTEENGHTIKRNCSFFKRLSQETQDTWLELRFENETDV